MKKIKSDPVKNILAISVGMTVVYFVTEWKFALIISFSIGLIGLLSEYLAKKVDFIWMKLTWVLSLIVPNLLMILIYYAILTPIALIYRTIVKRDPLTLNDSKRTLFKDSNKSFGQDSFRNPW